MMGFLLRPQALAQATSPPPSQVPALVQGSSMKGSNKGETAV